MVLFPASHPLCMHGPVVRSRMFRLNVALCAAGRLGLAACHQVLFEEDMLDEYGYDLPVQP